MFTQLKRAWRKHQLAYAHFQVTQYGGNRYDKLLVYRDFFKQIPHLDLSAETLSRISVRSRMSTAVGILGQLKALNASIEFNQSLTYDSKLFAFQSPEPITAYAWLATPLHIATLDDSVFLNRLVDEIALLHRNASQLELRQPSYVERNLRSLTEELDTLADLLIELALF